MTKQQIVETLEETHRNLFDWLENQPIEKWQEGPKEKWTTGQHILHLAESLQLLNKALRYPKFLLKYKFGISNRISRNYQEVAERYHQKLDESQDKAKVFNKDLKIPSDAEKAILIAKLTLGNKKLQKKLKNTRDKDLNTVLLPHPLMGRMTLREIIMWTAHHTAHHTETLKNNY